ncbi:MAG: ABC transporter ATP-binding protein [Proteobacteria bacterium]|nr:ABC transporter ATP-binding protein [Pseudomonadota bacterium]
MTLLKIENLTKIYIRGAETVKALDSVSFSVNNGEFVAITGPSGSGKTTLLHILGCLDRPTSGEVYIDDKAVGKMNDKELDNIRRLKIGFIFQQFYLLPELNVIENIKLPLLFSGNPKKIGEEYLNEILDTLGILKRKNHKPKELSGGEMQRVAIARALVNKPEFILADEPTANLDSENSIKIFELLKRLVEKGITVIVVTHNNELASLAERRIKLKDGRIIST